MAKANTRSLVGRCVNGATAYVGPGVYRKGNPMAQDIFTAAFDLVIGADLQGDLAMATVHLFNTAHTPSPQDDAAALLAIETTFSGYAPATVTAAGAPYLEGATGATVSLGSVQFVFTGPTGDNIFGYFVLDSTGKLISQGRFAAVVPIANVGQGIQMEVLYTVLADNAIECVMNGVPQ
jgi:hypothetical protein